MQTANSRNYRNIFGNEEVTAAAYSESLGLYAISTKESGFILNEKAILLGKGENPNKYQNIKASQSLIFDTTNSFDSLDYFSNQKLQNSLVFNPKETKNISINGQPIMMQHCENAVIALLNNKSLIKVDFEKNEKEVICKNGVNAFTVLSNNNIFVALDDHFAIYSKNDLKEEKTLPSVDMKVLSMVEINAHSILAVGNNDLTATFCVLDPLSEDECAQVYTLFDRIAEKCFAFIFNNTPCAIGCNPCQFATLKASEFGYYVSENSELPIGEPAALAGNVIFSGSDICILEPKEDVKVEGEGKTFRFSIDSGLVSFPQQPETPNRSNSNSELMKRLKKTQRRISLMQKPNPKMISMFDENFSLFISGPIRIEETANEIKETITEIKSVKPKTKNDQLKSACKESFDELKNIVDNLKISKEEKKEEKVERKKVKGKTTMLKFKKFTISSQIE